MSKTQRRVARKLMFPIIAIAMMTSMMAIAGSNGRAPAAAAATP